MKHGSLFSGIGGFDLAAQWVGWENIFQVEIDDYCQKVLTKNFPNVKRFRDIKEFKGERGSVDVLSGGFPCQPFSHAGKRKGKGDDRYLWPEYFRLIREIQPSYVVGENVAGLISMDDGRVLDGILLDLESEGYYTEQFIIPACGVGAWHRRARIWITAHRDSSCSNSNSTGSHRQKEQQQGKAEFRDKQIGKPEGLRKNVSNSNSTGLEGYGESKQLRESDIHIAEGHSGRGIQGWELEPNVGRVAHGIPKRVDRLKGLGNAIVPQVAYEIFRAIEAIND